MDGLPFFPHTTLFQASSWLSAFVNRFFRVWLGLDTSAQSFRMRTLLYFMLSLMM